MSNMIQKGKLNNFHVCVSAAKKKKVKPTHWGDTKSFQCPPKYPVTSFNITGWQEPQYGSEQGLWRVWMLKNIIHWQHVS